jgi:toxin ParE1/3/4
MQLRWTEAASADLERAADYLFEHSTERASGIVQALYAAPSALLLFPLRGRMGRKPGTRELVLIGLPYIVVYTVREEIIYVVRVLHGAQKWP